MGAPHKESALRGPLLGLAAAISFGASAPVAKLLLPSIGPLSLAGLLYLGAGIALTVYRLLAGRGSEAAIQRSDLWLVIGIVLTGGVFGPILMLVGLEESLGLTGALLLNLEAPFTIMIAVLFFREHLGARESLGAVLVIIGAASLAWSPDQIQVNFRGSMAIAGACMSWAIDNNLTQRLSLRDPISIVQVKTLSAGALTTVIALLAGHELPSLSLLAPALLLGSVSYGLSIVLDVHALRSIGAAREAIFFSTAPFAGALLAIPLLGERPSWLHGVASLVMIGGVSLLLRSKHAHEHAHEELVHDHQHVHDAHHQHEHDGPITEPHAHPHRHPPMRHSHPHVSDLHHRHSHREDK
jgi:drug/metabolite transporter (DMT)-like permease